MPVPQSAPGLRLAGLGNVPMSYVHEWRVAQPQEPILLAGAILKWYHVRRQSTAISPDGTTRPPTSTRCGSSESSL